MQFSTRKYPCLNELYHLFYKNGQKVVPENIITLLDPVALAHWISGDGEVANRGIRLCTDSFSLPEVERLINVLIVINGDKIINFFTNKYIKLYVKWNMKLIGLEVFGLGASILYFMYKLSMVIHFIATHLITGL